MADSSRSEPDLSIVIPAHNEAGYVDRALASVAAQTWPLDRLEVIVAENGSTDATRDVVRSIAASQNGLAVRLISEPVAARGRAKNRGAREARGAAVLFLDADSTMAPDLAARVVEEIRGGHPAGSIRVVADDGDRVDRAFFDLMEFGKVLFGIRAQMFYCRRDLFLDLGGFDEALQLAEDREFLVRLQRTGVPVTHVRESAITTSPRRLHTLPFHLGMLTMFARWTLGHAGIGRRWPY